MRKTKIVCTIGPASESVENLVEMINEGMNVARLNFSHGSQEEHRERIKNIRKANEITGENVAIMLDTKGPEIRIGVIENNSIFLKPDDKISLKHKKEFIGNQEEIYINYPTLLADVKLGDMILLDDGLIALKVIEILEDGVSCQVLNGGELSSRKGVNIPGVNVNLPSITEKDISDIHFGIKENIDFIAASFIRTPQDVLAIRKILEDNFSDIHIISKIENQEGVFNFKEILEVSDGIMVARGDLGVEIPAEEVPLVQKDIIRKCNRLGKPVITATQMLDSMMRNPRPTRAEASDVANAILDGTDAIMLSGETAAGKYPIQSVNTMARIAEKMEQALPYGRINNLKGDFIRNNTTDAISHATCTTANDLNAAAILTITKSGFTARMVAKYRPKSRIVAATPCKRVLTKLSLVWGVEAVLSPESDGTDDLIKCAIDASLEEEKVSFGDLLIVTAGLPVGISGNTNLLKVEVVGKIMAQGTGIGKEAVSGYLKIVNSADEANLKIGSGDILVASETTAKYIKAIEKSSAIITEHGGLTSHAAIVGLNLGKPVIVGVEDAREKLIDGMLVTLDFEHGLIYKGKITAI